MSYSIQEATGDGETTQFTIAFTLGYLDKKDVTCRVGDEVDSEGEPAYRELTWIDDSGIVEVGGDVVADGVTIVFQRTVDVEALRYDFQKGEEITEQSLDDSHRQLLMAVHEMLDGVGLKAVAVDIDMQNHKLVNLYVDPEDEDSVATVGTINAQVVAAEAAQEAAETAQAAAEAAQTAAETSETNAATSETNAATSETNAASSAEEAVAAATSISQPLTAWNTDGLGVQEILSINPPVMDFNAWDYAATKLGYPVWMDYTREDAANRVNWIGTTESIAAGILRHSWAWYDSVAKYDGVLLNSDDDLQFNFEAGYFLNASLTMFAKFKTTSSFYAICIPFRITDGTNYVEVSIDATGLMSATAYIDSTSYTTSTVQLEAGTNYTIGVRIRATALTLFIDGALAGTVYFTGGDVSTYNQLLIGSNGTHYLNAPLKRLAIFPQGLTDAQIQFMTET